MALRMNSKAKQKPLRLRASRGRQALHTKPPKSLLTKPSGIYDACTLLPLPPGFQNKWNSCYANSTLHCFFSILSLRQLCTSLLGVHPEECTCKPQGIAHIQQYTQESQSYTTEVHKYSSHSTQFS